MKIVLSLSFLIVLICSNSSLGAKTIFADGTDLSLDLSGYDGRDGHHGGNCEEGEDGEDGGFGETAYIYYSNILDLKSIELDMSGGLGGEAGRSGTRYNCDYNYGDRRARDGSPGLLGYLYLINKNEKLIKEKSVASVDFSNAHDSVLNFYSHSWIVKDGAKLLFNDHSDIRDEYYSFDKTVYSTIGIKLSKKLQELELDNTKLSVKYDLKYTKSPKLSLISEGQKLKALIDYNVDSSEQEKSILVNSIYFKDEISNSRFVGVKGSGENTTISIQDPTFLDPKFENRFSFTVYKYHPFIDHYVIVGQASSSYLPVSKIEDVISINLGKANRFKGHFQKGSKYKLKLNIRKSIGENSLGYGMSEFINIGN